MNLITISEILDSLSLVSVWLSGRWYFSQMVEWFGQGGSVTVVSWADLGKFYKSAPNGLKTAKDAYLAVKIFSTLQSPDYHGESLDYPHSWFWVCDESDRNFSKVYQMAYWYPKTLIWARKKFSNYDRPTIVIVDLPTIVSQKWFFQKFRKWIIDSLERLFGPQKFFPTIAAWL